MRHGFDDASIEKGTRRLRDKIHPYPTFLKIDCRVQLGLLLKFYSFGCKC